MASKKHTSAEVSHSNRTSAEMTQVALFSYHLHLVIFYALLTLLTLLLKCFQYNIQVVYK